MRTTSLSPAELTLFQSHVERGGHLPITGDNRATYDELVQAGLMVWGHTFRDGRNSICKLTKEGFERKVELMSRARESA
jgi:hypothetical protein